MTEQPSTPINLTKFLTPVRPLTLKQRQEARLKLEDLTKNGLGVERLPQENLAQALASSFYSRISPEFLRMSQVHHYEGHTAWETPKPEEMRVPKFGVYALDNPLMELHLGYDFFPLSGYFFQVHSPAHCPEVIQSNLLLSTDFGEDHHPELWWMSNRGDHRRNSGFLCPKDKKVLKPIRKKYYKTNHILSSTFYGFLPESTKQEIIESKTMFGNNIFLVAETNPEDWSVTKRVPQKVVQDPLIIGVIGDKCYLVDHFNTSPVEDYARREFTSD